VGRRTWTEWLGDPFILGEEVGESLAPLTDHLIRRDFLFDDNGILGIGDTRRKIFGARHFLGLMAVAQGRPRSRSARTERRSARSPVSLSPWRRRRGTGFFSRVGTGG